MDLTYDGFKEYVEKNDQFGSSVYSVVIKMIKEFYDEDKIKFFYPKKFRKPDEMEYILFFENGYSVITKNESEYRIEQYYCNVKSKEINSNRYIDSIELIITFDNGNTIRCDNHSDSAYDMENIYLEHIKKLIKTL